MAWVKIPPENHPLFRAALPRDPRIQTLNMFGGVAAKVNGNLFGGTFGRSVMLLLSPDDRETALALDGAAPFDPMGNGTKRSDKIQMPDSIMDEPDELRSWVKRAFDFAATLPANAKKVAAKRPAPKAAAKKPAARKPAVKRPALTISVGKKAARAKKK
jgi:TfoX/Sxy family transcriptional regulator of competence genes